MKFSYPEIPSSGSQMPAATESEEKSLKTSENNQFPGNTSQEDEPQKGVIFTIAHLISWISVPVLMPVYGILLIFHLSVLSLIATELKWIFTFIVIGLCTILPILIGLALKAAGVIKDVALNNRKERLFPYLATALCFIITGGYFITRHAPAFCAIFFIGGGAAALINALINLRWKISAHLAGIGGVVALVIAIALKGLPQMPVIPWLAGVIVWAGLIGSARLLLRRHTLGQVAAGFAVGFLCVLIPTLFF